MASEAFIWKTFDNVTQKVGKRKQYNFYANVNCNFT